MALVPILFLVLARVSWPNIGMRHRSRKAPTEYKCLIGPKAHQSWTHDLTHQIWVHGGTLMYPPTYVYTLKNPSKRTYNIMNILKKEKPGLLRASSRSERAAQNVHTPLCGERWVGRV